VSSRLAGYEDLNDEKIWPWWRRLVSTVPIRIAKTEIPGDRSRGNLVISILRRTPAVFGLSALAVAVPLFEVLANGPEFFVARSTTLGTAVALVVVICAGVPLALLAVELALARVSTSAGAVYHHLLIACLMTAMALPWFEGSSTLGAAAQVAIAAVAGAACSVAAARFAPIQRFLALLAPASAVVPLLFLFNPGIRDALMPSHAALAASRVGQTPPVVFIVFDEFPLISLLDERREIDADRYPNLAAFSQRAYWFRNASGVSSQTAWAVPAIVSGRYPTAPNAVPTLRYYPNNLFTLLSSAYDITLFGRFLQLCSPNACDYDRAIPGDTVPALVADLAIVWLHVVLPEPYTQELPPIVGDWRGFARARRTTRGGESGIPPRLAEFDRFMATIDAKPARLYFLHSTLPHMPLEFVPSGRRYVAPDYQGRREQGAGLFTRASAEYANSLYQRHLLQVGFVDHLLGRLFERLRDLGIYDTSLIVITADHGASFQEGEPRRELGKNNAADLMMVPLFIKVPGDPGGIVLDSNVTTVDILPTVADVLSVKLPFEVDGRPLLTERVGKATKSYVLRTLRKVDVLEIADWAEQAERSLQRKLRRFGSHDEAGLYALPETRALLGRDVAALPKAKKVDVRVNVSGARRVADADETTGLLPLYVRGTVESSDPGSLRLAVTLNGVVAATTAPFQQGGVWVFATLVPERYLSARAQDVRVFVIAEEGGRFMLSETDGGSARRARR